MLDSQRRQVGIGDQVCLYTSRRQERSQYIAMPLRRLGNPDDLGFEPSVDLAPRFRHGLGALEHARVRDNAQKGEEAWPRQTNRPAAIQLRVEPTARLRMLRKGADVGIDEQVGVEQNHRNDSLSATVSTSATLSTLPSRQRPRSTDPVR